MFNRKVVEFDINSDRKFAIRRFTLIGYQYKDLKHIYWWGKNDRFFRDCLGTYDEVRERLVRQNRVMSVGQFQNYNQTGVPDRPGFTAGVDTWIPRPHPRPVFTPQESEEEITEPETPPNTFDDEDLFTL